MRQFFRSQMYDEIGRKSVRLQKLILFLIIFQVLALLFTGFGSFFGAIIYLPILIVGFVGAAKRRPGYLKCYWISHLVLAILSIFVVIFAMSSFHRMSHEICADAPEGTSKVYVVWIDGSEMAEIEPVTDPATEIVTQPATEMPTQPAVEIPTKPATQMPTKPAVEIPTHAVTELPSPLPVATFEPTGTFGPFMRHFTRHHDEDDDDDEDREAQVCYEAKEEDHHCSTDYSKSRYIGHCVNGKLQVDHVQINPFALIAVCVFVATILVVKVYTLVLAMQLPRMIKTQAVLVQHEEPAYPQEFYYVPVAQEYPTPAPVPQNPVLSDEELARQLQAQYDREL